LLAWPWTPIPPPAFTSKRNKLAHTKLLSAQKVLSCQQLASPAAPTDRSA
jgi:hypothetical protein